MTPKVISYTRDDLLSERTQLLGELGVATVREADARADSDGYTGEQLLRLDRLHDVVFLLGDEE